MVKLVMRVAHVAPIRARCFNSKRTSFHVALELEHMESVDLRSEIRKADAVLPVFARAGQRSDTLNLVTRRGRCRLLFLLGVQHLVVRVVVVRTPTPNYLRQASQNLGKYRPLMRALLRYSTEHFASGGKAGNSVISGGDTSFGGERVGQGGGG